MSVAPVIALIVCGVCLVDAANLGHHCSTSDDCTASNSFCFKEFNECKGMCTCYNGYQDDVGANKCKAVRLFQQSCNASEDVCAADATCIGSPPQCLCATGLWFNQIIKKCVLTGQKEVGAKCTDNTGCYMGSSMSECVPDPDTSDPKYCRCRGGYMTTTYRDCRKPTFNEACTPAVGCESVISNSEDESQVNAVCTQTSTDGESYKCSCPGNAAMISTTIKQVVYNVCLTTYTGTQTALGKVCTTSNSCDGKLCALCPQAEARICVSAAPVVLSHPCSTNADCTATVANSYCHKEFSECNVGTCKCISRYLGDDRVDTCRPIKLSGQTCNPSTDMCEGDKTCTGSPLQCRCATGTEFNTNLEKCVATGKNEVGVTCMNNNGCYLGSFMTECVADSWTTDPKYCRCRSGYLPTTKKGCTMPKYGEPCTPAIGCRSDSSYPDDTSQVDVICTPTTPGSTSYNCSCPATAEKTSTAIDGITNTFCLQKYDGELKDHNSSCTASNSCTSKLCMKCGLDGGRICAPGIAMHDDGKGGSETMRSTVGVLLGIVVLPFLNRMFL